MVGYLNYIIEYLIIIKILYLDYEGSIINSVFFFFFKKQNKKKYETILNGSF